MSSTLTCWKEIAQYLGKGVRTVQRWETTVGLPVRRPPNCPSGVVLAYPEELDEWLHSTCMTGPKHSNGDLAKQRQEIGELQNELEKLRAENILLRQRLGAISQGELQQTSDDNFQQFRMSNSAEWYSRVLTTNVLKRHECLKLVESARQERARRVADSKLDSGHFARILSSRLA